MLGDDVRALADRPFFKGAARAQRSGLRTTATFAGSSRAVDLDTLLPEQSSEVISLLAEVDRAGLASASVEGRSDVRLDLLGRDEFGPVRTALGLPPSWHPGSAVPRDVVQKAVEARLEPRERQALGLKYLGYSDKEMARLMDVQAQRAAQLPERRQAQAGVVGRGAGDALRALRRSGRERRAAASGSRVAW